MWVHEHHEEIEKLICSKCECDKNKDYSPCKNCKRGDDFELGYKTAIEWHYVDKEPLPEKTVVVESVNGNLFLAYYVNQKHISLTGGVLKGIFKWKEI